MRTRFLDWLRKSNWLGFDLLLTFGGCLFWFWFAWQYGFHNSPDSWYRGVLGKSIVEGHPYFINLKQGWLYNYGPWHHDVAHEPLLPIIYAIFFCLFGYRIIIANIVSVLSVAILLFPLLRLSRRITKGNPWLGIFIYLLLSFNKDLAFLFEVLAGLSIPTTLLAIICYLFCLDGIINNNGKGWFWGAIISLVAFYYNRADSQLVFFGLMMVSVVAARKMLMKTIALRIEKIWLISFVFIAPLVLRKTILFGQPFFSHLTPVLWADRGYDYWTYHETFPLPSLTNYFRDHNLIDFVDKVIIKGSGNIYSMLQLAVIGPLWLYSILFLGGLIFIVIKLKEKEIKYLFLSLWAVVFSYLLVFALVPVLETRYFAPLYFGLIITIGTAIFMIRGEYLPKSRNVTIGFYALLIIVSFFLQRNFWLNLSKDYLHFSYQTEDQLLQQDPLVAALNQKRIDRSTVILGPFAEVQRLAFATGLTLIEEPDNLKHLLNPIDFFQKYQIRYSLVNITAILPKERVEKMEIAGDRILFTIDHQGRGKPEEEALQLDEYKDKADKQSISRGIRGKSVFIDAFHAALPADFFIFKELGLKVFISSHNYVINRDKLFNSDLLLLQYAQGKKELTDQENVIIRQFISNGGRILLLCPAWVWVAYEKKGLERLPYQQIANNFQIILCADYVAPPLRLASQFAIPDINNSWAGTFSNILYNRAEPIMVGSDHKTAAVAAKLGTARIIVWAQNNLLTDPVSLTPEGKKFLKKIFAWLLD